MHTWMDKINAILIDIMHVGITRIDVVTKLISPIIYHTYIHNNTATPVAIPGSTVQFPA